MLCGIIPVIIIIIIIFMVTKGWKLKSKKGTYARKDSPLKAPFPFPNAINLLPRHFSREFPFYYSIKHLFHDETKPYW